MLGSASLLFELLQAQLKTFDQQLLKGKIWALDEDSFCPRPKLIWHLGRSRHWACFAAW